VRATEARGKGKKTAEESGEVTQASRNGFATHRVGQAKSRPRAGESPEDRKDNSKKN